MQRLFEQYRPTSWADLIGQDKVEREVSILRRRGLMGRAYLLTGPTGCGKTSAAYLIAREVAGPDFIQELDAGLLTADRLAEWECDSHYCASGPGGRAYVVNEAHRLKPSVVAQLLVALERMPAHVAWLFTSIIGPERVEGDTKFFQTATVDTEAWLSRCQHLALTSQGLAKPGAVRLLEIARAENLVNGDPEETMLKRLERIIHDEHGNLRAALQRIEKGALL